MWAGGVPAKRSVRVNVRLARVGKNAPRSGALAVVVRQRGKVTGRARITFGPGRWCARPRSP